MTLDKYEPTDPAYQIFELFETSAEVAGFIVSKKEDKITFDSLFSEQFLGKTGEEAYSTLVTVIAAMRDTADKLTSRLVQTTGIDADKIKAHIAEVYYQISKLNHDDF